MNFGLFLAALPALVLIALLTFLSRRQRWNSTHSSVIHDRLRVDDRQWHLHHGFYRRARASWPVLPYQDFVSWVRTQAATHLVIADFGCGEAFVASELSPPHTVHSFDHVAADKRVVACDMAHTPMADGSIDVALFSLSLMGTNVGDYIREAHRTLKPGGEMHVYEESRRFKNLSTFTTNVGRLGFDVMAVDPLWSFTRIRARKNAAAPDLKADLRL